MEEKITSIKFETTEAEKSVKQLRQEISGLRDVILNTEEGTEEYNSAVKQLITSQDELNKVTDKTIKGTTAAAGSYEALVFEMAQLKKEWRATGDEAKRDEIGKQIVSLNNNLKDMDASIGNFQRNVGDYSGALSAFGGQLDSLVPGLGGLLTGAKAASGGLMGMVKSALAFIATPLGAILSAIVVVLSSLKTAFTASEEGQNKWTKVVTISSAILGNFTDLLADLGEKLIWVFENPKQALNDFAELIKKNIINRFNGLLELVPELGKAIGLLFKGEFSEAGKVATNAVAKVALGVDDVVGKVEQAVEATKDFIKEQEKEATQAGRVADMRAKAAKLDRQMLVERSKIEAEIAQLRVDAKDVENLTEQQRLDALKKADKLQDELYAKEAESLRLKYEAQRLENTFSRTNIENLDKEAAALAAISQAETRRLTEKRALAKEANTLTKQIRDKEKKIAEEAAKAEADRLAKLIAAEQEAMDFIADKKRSDEEREIQALQEAFDKRVEQIGIEKAIELGLEEQFKNDLKAVNDKYRAKEKEADKKAADDKKKLQKENLDFSLSIAGALSSILNDIGEANTKDAKKKKKLQIASAYIDMLAGAVSAFTQAGNPILGAFMAASVVTAGLVNIKKMKETKIEGSSGGDSVATPSVNVANLMATQKPVQAVSTTTGASAEQKIQDTRVYVVESDIAATTKKVAVAQAEATY